MSAKNLALLGVSALLTTCLPKTNDSDGLKIISPKSETNSNAEVIISIENYSDKKYSWQLILDNEMVVNQRNATFPFDSIWRFQYEGDHLMLVKYWDKTGSVKIDSIKINNAK